MSKRQPATAYDYRRVIALVQTLAHYGSDDGVKALCAAWGVEPVEPFRGGGAKAALATIRKLAQHALEHGHGGK